MTIELDGFLWTGDKKLINGLQKKSFNKFCELQGSELYQISPKYLLPRAA
ncbi:MAG: hypothetical protein NT166_24090 [Candidatus Aminicenantes bacterium]|nr:hypothetical protein [Candidatus Aminicenantes bacterium]